MSRRDLSRTALAIAAGGAAVATVGVAVARSRRGPDVPLRTVAAEEQRREVETSDGGRLVVRDVGTGPTVVLSHCWTGTMDVWGPVAAELVDRGFRVVRYDQRGHGGSTGGRDTATIARLGRDLAEVLQALDVRDAVLAGHSMGGMSAIAFAIDHPEELTARVRALVLVSTSSGGLTSPQAKLLARLVADPVVERLVRSRRGAAFVRGVFGSDVSPAALELTRDTFAATSPEVRRDQLRAMLDMELRERCSSISVPTTVVVGSRDGMTPPRHARHLAGTIGGARLVVMPRAGHMLPLEAPERLAGLIAEAAEHPASVAGPADADVVVATDAARPPVGSRRA